MTDHTQHAKNPGHGDPAGHGDYERSDIGISGVIYFLVGLALACVFSYFIVKGVFWGLETYFESTQSPVSPLVPAPQGETRMLPPEYKTDATSTDYEKYLQKNFPQPQLETDEQTEL